MRLAAVFTSFGVLSDFEALSGPVDISLQSDSCLSLYCFVLCRVSRKMVASSNDGNLSECVECILFVATGSDAKHGALCAYVVFCRRDSW